MIWDTVKSKIENILNTGIELKRLSIGEWETIFKYADHTGAPVSMEHQHEVLFYLYEQQETVFVFAVNALKITQSERKLLEMMIEAYSDQGAKPSAVSTAEEKNAELLKQWIQKNLELGKSNEVLPDFFASQTALYSAMVPLLLYGDYADSRTVSYIELKRLLESFFELELTLIPLLEKEWLILVPEALLDRGQDDKADSEQESIEEALQSICLGLYEMMVSEGIGECHLAIHYPMIPNQSILPSVSLLREAIFLGRTYRVSTQIHLSWELHLERILNVLPDSEKKKVIESILKRNDYMMDTETTITLEEFFKKDCNVSETAKSLFIHRNTLLYRLDKFKQETGLDVRRFNDAILVKIFMLLYKVTKRK